MWSRLTNLAQTVQGQLEEAVEETANTSSQEQLQSSTTTTVRRMVVHREVTLSSGSTLSIQELREQFDQQQLQIEQLKHLVRENEQQLKIKHKELEETNAKFSKFKLQAKAKSISEKREENKKLETKTQAKGSDHIDDGGTSEQANRGKLLVFKKKLEDKEKLLIEKGKELSMKNNLLTEQERHLQERETIIQELNMKLKHLQDSINQSSDGTLAQSKESSDSQQMFAQIVYKDNKILELDNKILQQDQNIMSLQEHVKEKEEVIQARTKAIQLVQKEITEKDQQLEDQNTMVQKLTKHVEQDEEQLSLLREQLQLKDDQLRQETEQFSLKLQETQKYFEETLDERNNVVHSLHQKLEELNARYQQDKQVWSRRAKENIQDEALYRLEQRMKEKDDVIDAKNEVIEQLQKEKADKEKHFVEESMVLKQNFNTLESEMKAEKVKFELILKDIKEKHETELNEKVTTIKEFEKEIETLKLPVTEQLDQSKSEKQELLQRISELENEIITKEDLVTQLKMKVEEPSSSGKSGAKFLKYKAQSAAKIKSLQAELVKLKEDSNLADELVSLKNQIAELEDDKGNLQLNLLDFEETKALQVQSHNQILELKEKLERQNGDLDQYIQALGKVEKDKLSMLEYIQKLEGTLQKGKFEQDAQQETLLLTLKEELDQTHQFMAQLQEERDQERKERINFEMKLVEYQDYKKHAEIDIINLNEKLEEHQCEIAQLQNQLAGQEALKIRLEEEKVALELKLVELEEQTEGVEVQKLELIKETCRLQEHLEYEKQPNIAFETEKEELLKQLEVLRLQQQGHDEEKKTIIIQFEELKNVNENVTLQISRITEHVDQLQEENKSLETTIINKDIEINELQTFKIMVDNLNSELSLKSQELHSHLQIEEHLKSQIDDLQIECRQMENELRGLTSSSASTENSLKIVSEEMNNKNSELQILKEKLEHEATITRKYESDLDEHKHNMSSLEDSLLEKSDTINNLQFEINRLYNEIKTFEVEKEQISVVYKEQLMEVQNILDIKDQKLNEYETELKHIQLECHQKETLLKELDNKLKMSCEEISTLEHKQAVGDEKIETKMKSFLQQMSELESEVSSLQETNNEYENLKVNLQDQLIHCKRELEEKETTLANTKLMLEEMAINFQEKDNYLKQLQNEYQLELESSKQKLIEFSQIREKDVCEKSNINSQLEQNSVTISQLESILSERERNIEALNKERSQNSFTIKQITQIVDEKSHIEQSLRDHIEELEKKLNSNSEVVIKLEDESNQSKLYIESLEVIIQEKIEALNLTQNRLDETIFKLQELQQLQQNIEQEKHLEKHHLDQLNIESQISKEQIAILQVDLDKAKYHIQELELIQQSLEQEKLQLQQTCIEMAQKYTTLEFEVERLNTSVRDYQSNVELSQESVNKLQAQMEQQKEIIQELQRELHSNIQQREVADISRVETENKNKQLHETITKLKVGLKKHLKEKDELVSKLENMEVEKAQYMQEKQHFEEEVQQLQSARLEMLEVNNQQLTEQIRTLEVEAEHNQMSKNELAALLDKQELEKQQLLELKQGLEGNIKSQKEEMNQQIKSLEDECHSKEVVVLKLNEQIHLFEEELNHCKEEINNQKKELEILDLKRQELEIELKQTSDHLQMLQSSSSEHVQTLSSELEKANEEIKNLNIRIITISNQEKESKQKSNNYKSEMNKLHSELDHTLAGVAQFKTENHILKEQLSQEENLKSEFQIKYKEKLEQSEADRDHILLLERKIIEFEQSAKNIDKNLVEKDFKLCQLEDLSTKLKVMQEENQKLLMEKENSLFAISKKDDEINLLENKLLQSQELMEESCRNIAAEKEMMLQSKMDLTTELDKLKSGMLQKEIELRKEIEFLTEEKDRSNFEWENFLEENRNMSQQMSTELKDLKQYVNELESEKMNRENLMAKLQESLEDEKKNKIEIEKELENVKEYLNILQCEREKLQEDITNYDKRVQFLQLELLTLGEDLTTTKSELLVSQDHSQKSAQSITALQNEIVHLQQQGNQREDSLALDYNKMQMNVHELLKALEEKSEQLDVMGNDYVQLKKQCHQLNEELAQNIHEKKQLQDKIETCVTQQNKRQDEELSFFKEQCAQFAIIISQLEKEKEEFKIEIEQEKRRADEFTLLENECTRLKNTIVELTVDKENLEEMLKKCSQHEFLLLEKPQSESVEISLQEEHYHMTDKNKKLEEKSNVAEVVNEEKHIYLDQIVFLKEQIIDLERDKQELQTLVQQNKDLIIKLEKSQMESATVVSETWVEKSFATHVEKQQLLQSDNSDKKNNQNYDTLIKEHEELKLLYDKTKIKSEKMLIKLKQFKDRHDKIQEELKASHQEIEHLKLIHVQSGTSHEEMIKGFEIRIIEIRKQAEIAELHLNKQNKIHLDEVNRLQSNIKNLEEEFESLHNDFKTLKSDHQKLLREKEYIEKEKEKVNVENWKLMEQLEQNKQQYEEQEIQDKITIEALRSQANENIVNIQIEAGNKERWEREIRTTLEQMEQLSLDNGNYQILVENLTTVKIKLEEEIKNQQKSNVALSLENQQLKDATEKWKSRQTDKKDTTEKLVEDLNRIRLELEIVQNKYDELKLHSDDLVYKKETLEIENRQGQETLIRVNMLNEQLQEQIVVVQQESNEFRKEIEILSDEKEQLLFQFANSKRELESLSSEKEKTINEHSCKEDVHLEENKKLDKELASVKIDYEVLLLEKNQEIEKRASAEESYLQQVSELHHRDIKLTAEVVSLRQTSLEFKQQYNLIETECEHFRNLMQQRDDHIVSITQVLDKLKIENSQMAAELKHWNSQRQEMAQGSANLQPIQDPEVLQKELHQAMQSVHLRESRIEQLTSHIAQLLEEKSSLSMQLSSTSRLKQERDAQIYAIQNQYQTLEIAIRQKQDEINTLQRHLQIKSPRVEAVQQLPSSNVDPAQMHVLLKRLETSEHLQKSAEERNIQLEEQLTTEREQRLQLEDELNRTQEKLQRESQLPLVIPDFILSMDSEEQNPKILETSHTLTRQVRSHASKIQKWLSRRNPLSRALRSRSALHILYLFYVIFLHMAVLHCYLF